jgi:molecular chaperone GrpE
MMGWVAFVLAIVAAAVFFVVYHRRQDATLTELRESARNEMSELKHEARSRVDRLEREADRSKHSARDKLLDDLLPVIDALLLARDNAPDDDARVGLELVVTEFERALTRHGVDAVTPQPGDRFDPQVHEAVEALDDDEIEPGRIGRCHRRGWQSEQRVLRPALVGVVKATAPSAAVSEPPDAEPVDNVVEAVSSRNDS